MGGLLALKAAERMPISGLVLLSSELPRDLRVPARAHELREIPDVYGKSLIGWETLPERLLRDDRDLTLRGRPAHPAPARPEAARGRRRTPRRCWAASRSIAAGCWRCRGSSIGAGLDRGVTMAESERLAEWLDAGYEPFAAHSHFGLVVGENSYQQVADAIRGFLEANRL